MPDAPDSTIRNPATELARIIADMESHRNVHLCPSCDLSELEDAEREGRRAVVFEYAPQLKAVLKALRSGLVSW